ncbi:MAG: DUF3365 domain-containing protein [Elainella sp. C42_A2020_010]|nr:DUF3365 domain-containing protein [Elainella sp. C42_A2020_010]RNJ66149.1 MAG: DUF3365 domain-containing protein [Leptolyngbya sp. IPPAS B-1204]
MLNRFKLGTKLSLLLISIFILGSVLGGVVLERILEQRAENQITQRGLVLMQTISSVRDYTNLNIVPLLQANLDPKEFTPEIVPSYAARQVFEILHKNQDYADLAYKEAVLNPTNLNDRADSFETSVIQQFEQDAKIKQISGFRQLRNEKMFYSARPLRVGKASCLQCHSTPAVAPKSMVKAYGEKNGFGWQLNSLIGAQMVYVPATEVFQSTQRAFFSVMGLFIGIFATAIWLLNFVLKPTVLRPVQQLARLSKRLGEGAVKSEPAIDEMETRRLAVVAKRQDELGQLAAVFQRMVQEVMAREQRLRQQIRELRFEIDEGRRQKEVEEITETDYFQELQKQAQEFRNQSAEYDDE